MDSLSVATGVLTLIGACNALVSTIRKLHHLQEAPRELETLERKITALPSYTEGINILLQTHGGTRSGMIGRLSLGVHVQDARQKIEQTQHFLDRSVLDLSSGSKIQKSAWLKWQSEFSRLRQELRDVRSEIAICICFLNAAESQGNAVQLQEIASETRAIREEHLTALEALREEAATQRPRLDTESSTQLNASPLDASDTGWTLFDYALSAGQLSTVKFLKDAGADLRAESTSRETPVDVAWNRILSGSLDEKAELLLRNVFEDDGELDERQSTTLHKIVLGIIGKDLADELEITTAHINATNSSRNTPLSWASARGDHRSVVLLLEHGASLSLANDVNAMPIHLAAQTGNIATVQALIRAGADVNSVVRQTQMTSIHYAAEYQSNSDQIHGLISLGAVINGKDYLSWTPLHWASWRGHLSSLEALLENGADVNARTLDGNASIMLAVANNSYECVGKLIEAGADCSIVRDSQWNILHCAAIGGSVDTVRSLAVANLLDVDIQYLRTKDTGQTVADMLEARLEALSVTEDNKGTYEAWKRAWDNLTISPLVTTDDTDHDAGFSHCIVRSNTDSVYFDAKDELPEHLNGSQPC
ncbi:MAG: hypothetical protein Q9209_004697 [Squamulea sp. 1 TL-2023]